MVRYEAFGPDAEVLGRVMLAFFQASQVEGIDEILARHDLLEIEPEAWYPQQKFLNVFGELAEGGSAMFDFVSVGLQVVNAARFPPGFDDKPFAEKLLNWGAVFSMNNRGEDAGSLRGEIVAPGHVQIIACVPYPDDFLYGNFYGVARRFLPEGTNFTVFYDDAVPCREQGGTATVINITWEAE